MIQELAISGGGIRGIAFISAIYELEKQGKLNIHKLKKLSGTSIGAFIGICLLSGYTTKELLDILFDYDLKQIKDIDLKNIISSKSILKGNALYQFYTTILEKKINVHTTLLELYEKTNIDFIATTCCLNTQSVEYISHETFPQLSIIECIKMSTAIPGILPGIIHEHKLYIDGGILDNLPLTVLSENAWGIKSYNSQNSKEKEYIHTNDFTFFQYFKTILKIAYEKKTTEHHSTQNIIYIDTKNVNVTSFNITHDQKFQLIQSGIDSVQQMFDTNQ